MAKISDDTLRAFEATGHGYGEGSPPKPNNAKIMEIVNEVRMVPKEERKNLLEELGPKIITLPEDEVKITDPRKWTEDTIAQKIQEIFPEENPDTLMPLLIGRAGDRGPVVSMLFESTNPTEDSNQTLYEFRIQSITREFGMQNHTEIRVLDVKNPPNQNETALAQNQYIDPDTNMLVTETEIPV